MKIKILKLSTVLQIAAGIIIAVIAVTVYTGQLNQAVTSNTLSTISELAQHDKRSIEAFIETCWDDLIGISKRFDCNQCGSILEVETRLNVECATSGFSHIYLLAKDGRVFTDKYVVYDPSKDNRNNFLPYFENGERRVVTRWDDKGLSREYVVYGVRLDNFQVDGVEMLALLGLSNTSSIQKHIILDSFMKDGVRRGYSAVISRSGNYVIGANKTLYLNVADNLYNVLSSGSRAELSNDEVEQKIHDGETFRFYYTDENGVRKLLYLTPFQGDISWYFMMVVEKRAFTEQSRQFVIISLIMLTVSLVIAVLLMMALTAAHGRTLRAVAKAKAQSDFLSNMSHEIRTPLNGLIGLNHLILTHIDDKNQVVQIKDWLHKSHSTANYLLSLVNDVLDMSKFQAGRADVISEPVYVETLIDAVWSMQRDNVEGRGVRLVVEQAIPYPCVMGDGTRIKQILMNIVGNAAKFTPAGGVITLSASQEKMDDGRVMTTYKCHDTGVGMSEEFMEKIFDAFSQERNKNSDSVKGTGLGMAICKLLVKAMGGEITVESELGVGTTFTVALPSEIAEAEPDYLHQKTDETVAQAEEIAETLHSDRPVKVLMAEDNELNAEILMDILTEEGFEVVHAENGRLAVDAFAASAAGEFDIILMDLQMPVLDGCGASVEIRGLSRPDARTVPIYACTANTFQEDRDRAMESGMNDFLTKPIDVDVLLKKIAAGTAAA